MFSNKCTTHPHTFNHINAFHEDLTMNLDIHFPYIIKFVLFEGVIPQHIILN